MQRPDRILLAVASCGLALCAGATPGAAAPQAHVGDRTLDEVRALFAERARVPGGAWVEALPLPKSRGGRDVPALVFGAPGERPLAERATVLLVGGLDGLSLAGAEAVVAVTEDLAGAPETLPADLAFVSIPWASPDALSRAAAGRPADGRNDRPTDDDLDGRSDEDPPDDLDGDGRVLRMLIEDPAGEWTWSPDPRFLRAARPGDSPRFRRFDEGADDDGDGLFNEDGVGGVDLDRSFPVSWRGRGAGGSLPLGEPLARALADLALERRLVLAFVFQGEHGALATPGGTGGAGWSAAPDAPAFETLARLHAAAIGRPLAGPPPELRAARGAERSGAFVDWLYVVPGVLAAEVAPFGPPADPAGRGARGDPLASWLDRHRGGLGFVDWHPVELGGGQRALIGGWIPGVLSRAPERAGLSAFVREAAGALPRLSVHARADELSSTLFRIRARVENRGALPSALTTAGRSPAARSAGTIELHLAAGARLLSGASRLSLAAVPGGADSALFEWLVHAPAGLAAEVSLESAFTERRTREVAR